MKTSSTFFNFMFQVFLSTSQKTGTARERITADKQDIIVKEGRITSSPSLSFRAFKATSNALLPLETAKEYFLLKNIDN